MTKNMLPRVVLLAIGLLVGLGIGQLRVSEEQKQFEAKMKEANRKIVFLQKKADASAEETRTALQQCQLDAEKLAKLEDEKDALVIQLGKLKDQARACELQVRECAEAAAQAKKFETQLREADQAKEKARKDLQDAEQRNKVLDQEMKQVAGEKQGVLADLKKKQQELEQCKSYNADLCLIAEELVEKYKSKGLGSVILQKEPLTQINRVKLEQAAQKYLDQIRQKKVTTK